MLVRLCFLITLIKCRSGLLFYKLGKNISTGSINGECSKIVILYVHRLQEKQESYVSSRIIVKVVKISHFLTDNFERRDPRLRNWWDLRQVSSYALLSVPRLWNFKIHNSLWRFETSIMNCTFKRQLKLPKSWNICVLILRCISISSEKYFWEKAPQMSFSEGIKDFAISDKQRFFQTKENFQIEQISWRQKNNQMNFSGLQELHNQLANKILTKRSEIVWLEIIFKRINFEYIKLILIIYDKVHDILLIKNILLL